MAITLDGTNGITTPALTNTGTETLVNLTTTGNTTLGDATTDTLTVGVTGIVKDSSGNVGIGTATAGYGDLTVKRQATTGTNATFSLVSGTAGYGRLFFGNTQNAAGEYDGFVQYDQANRLMQFGTAQAERMRIDSSGNLLVNATSASGKFTLKSSGATSGTSSIYITNSTPAYTLVVNDDGSFYTGASPAGSPYNANVGAVRTLMVSSAGQLGYNASTRNTKINITPLTSVNWLFDLQPVSFNYREKDVEGNYTDVAKADVHYGLIAEDTETINKELCFYNSDSSLAGVNYDMLAPALLKAIQEMKAIIDTQATLIQSLTTRISALEAK
jgi:hypothetical protein